MSRDAAAGVYLQFVVSPSAREQAQIAQVAAAAAEVLSTTLKPQMFLCRAPALLPCSSGWQALLSRRSSPAQCAAPSLPLPYPLFPLPFSSAKQCLARLLNLSPPPPPLPPPYRCRCNYHFSVWGTPLLQSVIRRAPNRRCESHASRRAPPHIFTIVISTATSTTSITSTTNINTTIIIVTAMINIATAIITTPPDRVTPPFAALIFLPTSPFSAAGALLPSLSRYLPPRVPRSGSCQWCQWLRLRWSPRRVAVPLVLLHCTRRKRL